jgi:hypothetical protein
MSDTAILDWLEREGLESLVRIDRSHWLNMWTSGPRITPSTPIYLSLRDAAIAGMIESAKETR